MITLAPLAREATRQVMHLTLPPAQQRYGGDIAVVTQDTDPNVDFHMVLAEEVPVGFFKIDRAYAARIKDGPLDEVGLRPGDLGLRAMIVGQQYQGRGYGTAGMRALAPYLAGCYQAPRAFLTVNCKNPGAIHVYQAGGWCDTGALYLGGAYGPQHILRLDLR